MATKSIKNYNRAREIQMGHQKVKKKRMTCLLQHRHYQNMAKRVLVGVVGRHETILVCYDV